MGLEVVDGDQRHAQAPGQRFRRRQPHQQRTDQSRLGGDGDGRQIREFRVGPRQGFIDHRQDAFDMSSRSDLRHDAAEPGVQLILAGDDA